MTDDGWVPSDEELGEFPKGLFQHRRCPRCQHVSPVWLHKIPFIGKCPKCGWAGRMGGWTLVERKPA